jgi:hypothetical protein
MGDHRRSRGHRSHLLPRCTEHRLEQPDQQDDDDDHRKNSAADVHRFLPSWLLTRLHVPSRPTDSNPTGRGRIEPRPERMIRASSQVPVVAVDHLEARSYGPLPPDLERPHAGCESVRGERVTQDVGRPRVRLRDLSAGGRCSAHASLIAPTSPPARSGLQATSLARLAVTFAVVQARRPFGG